MEEPAAPALLRVYMLGRDGRFEPVGPPCDDWTAATTLARQLVGSLAGESYVATRDGRPIAHYVWLESHARVALLLSAG